MYDVGVARDEIGIEPAGQRPRELRRTQGAVLSLFPLLLVKKSPRKVDPCGRSINL